MSDSNTPVAPADADERRAAPALICYDVHRLPPSGIELYQRARQNLRKTDEVIVPPRDGASFEVPAGSFFRIVSVEGSQVGDLNLWNARDLSERLSKGDFNHDALYLPAASGCPHLPIRTRR